MSVVGRLQKALKTEARRAQEAVSLAIRSLAAVHIEKLTGGSREQRHGAAMQSLAGALSRLKAAADLSGRLEIRFPSPQAPVPEEFTSRTTVISEVVPAIAFGDAIRDMAERDPLGAAELRRAGLEVEDLYGGIQSPEGMFFPHGFSAALAIDNEVARAVRDHLVAGLASGQSTTDIALGLASDWNWPRSYAENVVRTNFNTATTAGRFVEAERVASSGLPVAFRFSAVMDSDTRPGHAAMDGVIADVRDPVWRSWSPPLGFRCRCVLEPQIGVEIPVGSVTVPAGAEKDPGFGTRGDLRRYG